MIQPYCAIMNRHLAGVVSKNDWDTKEDKGKSTICVLYVLGEHYHMCIVCDMCTVCTW